jgi:hypothetical protein
MNSVAQSGPMDQGTRVNGVTLRARETRALHLASGRNAWMAYQIAVKGRIAIDTHAVEVPWDPAIHGPDVSVNVDSSATQDLGIFMHVSGTMIDEVQVFNLLRTHSFTEPLFWLGRVAGDESLNWLERLLETRPDLGVGLVRAVGVHRDAAASSLLKRYAFSPTLSEMARAEALCWLGQDPRQSSFLERLTVDRSLPLRARSAALLSLIDSSDPKARELLLSLRLQLNEPVLLRLIDRSSARSQQQ